MDAQTVYLDRCSLDGRALAHLTSVQQLMLLSLTGECVLVNNHIARLPRSVSDLTICTPNIVSIATLARELPELNSLELDVYAPQAFAPAAEPAPVLDLDTLVVRLHEEMEMETEDVLPPFPLGGTVKALQVVNSAAGVPVDDTWLARLSGGSSRLSLSGFPPLTDGTFDSLGALVKLELADCDGVVGAALQPLSDSLSHLFVRECGHFTGAGLDQLDALHALSVDRCPEFDATAFADLGDMCANLCHVTVRWAPEKEGGDDDEEDDDSDDDVPFGYELAEELLGVYARLPPLARGALVARRRRWRSRQQRQQHRRRRRCQKR